MQPRIENLTIGLLSWKAHETVTKTLESYAKAGLWDLAKTGFIYFNARSPEDDALAARFGVEARGTAENLGIWGGMNAIAEGADTEYVLMLQNDCPVVASPAETERYIREGLAVLSTGEVDIVRLRHRWNQGDGIDYRKFFRFHYVHDLDPRASRYMDPHVPADGFHDTLARRINRLVRPVAARRRLISVMHLERHPDEVARRYVMKVGSFYVVDSMIANFTEQPILMRRSLYLELADWCRKHPSRRRINGFPVMEHALNGAWWRNQHFKLAFCDEGVFTHNRFDDSFRPDHVCFNAGIAA